MKKLTKEEFIQKAKEKHGDKYDYSNVQYVHSKSKVKIICKEHGEFEQQPNNHLQGQGCLACKLDNSKLTTEQFIQKAKEIHGDKYDYSKVEYVNNATKVKIICPQHGEFEQTPNLHLRGSGCPACGGTLKLTTEEFIQRSNEIHGDKYDYSNVQYVNNTTKVKIICKQHGEFEQTPFNHLRVYGCPECGSSTFREGWMRDIIQEITGLSFPKKRPNWLRNEETNYPLELDCYNEDLKFAIEYHGKQHYEPVQFWGGEERLLKQQQRDKVKIDLCLEQGVILWRIDARRFNETSEKEFKKQIKKEFLMLLNSRQDTPPELSQTQTLFKLFSKNKTKIKKQIMEAK